MRAATGVAPVSPLPVVAGVPATDAPSSGAVAAVPRGRPAPASIRHSTAPTATVSSASTSSSLTVPATGDGSSASTLSVEISASGSSTATVSPGATRHSRIVPSTTESPISGSATSTISPVAPSEGSPSVGRGIGRGRAVARLDLAQGLADLNRLVGAHEDLGQHPRRRRGDLGVDLVGGHFDQRLVNRDGVPLGLEPLEHRSLGDRLAHCGHDDLDRRPLGCHPPTETLPGRFRPDLASPERVQANGGNRPNAQAQALGLGL